MERGQNSAAGGTKTVKIGQQELVLNTVVYCIPKKNWDGITGLSKSHMKRAYGDNFEKGRCQLSFLDLLKVVEATKLS